MTAYTKLYSFLRKSLAVAALILAVTACSTIPDSAFPDDSWQRKPAQWAGFPEGSIDNAVESFSGGNSHFTSLTVIKNGFMVYESFRDMSPGEMTALYSATKSINSLVTGIAVDRGILRDEHMTVGEIFPDYPAAAPGVEAISIQDILTMRGGIDYNEQSADYRSWLAADDRLAWILSRQLSETPGKTFRYQTPVSQILTRMVEQEAQRDFVSLTGELLFEPVGISSDRYLWRLDSAGHARVAACNMVPADLARIGLLILNNGMWKGQRVVSEQWLSKSFEAYADVKYGVQFGYHWWLRSARGFDIIGAEGYGGQCMYIIPGEDMVVVITGDFPAGPEDTFRFLSDYLLPILSN